MSKVNIPMLVKQQIVRFFTQFKHNFPDTQSRVEMELVAAFFSAMSEHEVYAHCVEHILPLKPLIATRKDSVIDTKRYELFKGLPPKRVDCYAHAWTSGIIDADNKAVAWAYLDIIVKLVEKGRKEP